MGFVNENIHTFLKEEFNETYYIEKQQKCIKKKINKIK